MPKGPKGEKRPADVIANAVRVMQIATGEAKEEFETDDGKDKAAQALHLRRRQRGDLGGRQGLDVIGLDRGGLLGVQGGHLRGRQRGGLAGGQGGDLLDPGDQPGVGGGRRAQAGRGRIGQGRLLNKKSPAI